MLTGRGWGKNKSISEWTHYKADSMPGSHGGLVARTTADVRDTVVLGMSGILATQKPWNPVEYFPSTRLLVWANGTTAHTFSSEEPAQLRGPNLHWAAGDEWATWKKVADEMGGTAMSNLEMATRVRGPHGEEPRIALGTTPRPSKTMRALVKDKRRVYVTRGTMYDNEANLAPGFVHSIEARYGGTRLGRQEIRGALLELVDGALVQQEWIDETRLDRVPPHVELDRGGVGVDPAGSTKDEADETGIVPAGLGDDGHLYVFPPASDRFTPKAWAEKACDVRDAYEFDDIVAEVNYGGDMVVHTIHSVHPSARVLKVNACRGKHVRFEPLSVWYEQRKVHHVGPPEAFVKLEDQVTSFTNEKYEGEESPNDADALVWIAKHLGIGGLVREIRVWGPDST
jgi:phage terminase large subunit-like protein